MLSKLKARRQEKRKQEFAAFQDERVGTMNAVADRAVQEVLHAITARIGIPQLRKMIDEAERDGSKKYTTLAELWFKQQYKEYPKWRKSR